MDELAAAAASSASRPSWPQRHRRVRRLRRPHAVRGHVPGCVARAACRGARRKRRDRARARPRARWPRVGRRWPTSRPRARWRPRSPPSGTPSPSPARRVAPLHIVHVSSGARRRSWPRPGPRSRRDLRDVPALPRSDGRGRRAHRRPGQVRAARCATRRSATGFGEPCATGRSTDRLGLLARAAETQGKATHFAAWGGISGCQTTARVLLAEGLTSKDIAFLCSVGPALRLGLPGGRVEPGRAPICCCSIPLRPCRPAGGLEYRHPQSPFVGRALRGRIARTLLRGRTVAIDGRAGGRAAGALVRPQNCCPALVL